MRRPAVYPCPRGMDRTQGGPGAALSAPLTRTARVRVLRRAAVQWRAGKPHKAWETLQEAGMGRYWPTFQRVAFREARRGYTRAMSRYTA